MIEINAINVENVSKDFILPHEKLNSIKSVFMGVTKKRNKNTEMQHALKNVSFNVKKGEFLGIVGRNGSGKSTLLKILAGIYQPTSGNVITTGKLVPFIELGVGFNPELTGRENIYLNGALLGFSKKEVTDMYDDIVAFAELERFMNQKLKNYSSGMQVRLAFSLATCAKADILLIDEVLAVGDAAFQKKCFDYFDSLKRKETTVVFVSHNMEAVREYCDRAILIEDNKIAAIGSTDKIAQHYMRLFMDTSTQQTMAKDSDERWGDQKIVTKNITVSATSQKILVKQTIQAMTKIDEKIVAGFRIRDTAGHEITGTNSKKENINLPKMIKDQKITLNWEMPNLLSDGKYIVDPSLCYWDEITVADWWNNAATFEVNKNRHLPYNIDPGFKMDIT